MSAPSTFAQQRVDPSQLDIELRLAKSTLSPAPDITVTLPGAGAGVKLVIGYRDVTLFNRQVLATWLAGPRAEAMSTGPVVWQHTAGGVALDYCGQRYVLTPAASDALQDLL